MASKLSAFRAAPAAKVEHRSAPRHRVLVSAATVRQHGQVGVDAALLDVSIFGCRFSCEEAYAPEDRIWVRFAGSMPVAATVIWYEAGATGCRFDAPISRSTVRALSLLDA